MTKNARTCIFTEPLWAVVGTAALYYLPILMNERGLSAIEIGWISSLTLAAGLMFQLMAGPLTARFGARRVTFVGDLFAWTLTMTLWGIAHSFLVFALAAITNSVSKVVGVSFWILATGDSQEVVRSRVVADIKLMIGLFGLTAPLFGYIAFRCGYPRMFEILYLGGAVIVLVQNLIRYIYTEESKTVSKSDGRSSSIIFLWESLLSTIKPMNRRLTVAYCLGFFAFQLTLFQSLYFKNTLRLSDLELGAIPALAAVGAIIGSLLMKMIRSGDSNYAAQKWVMRTGIFVGCSYFLWAAIPGGSPVLVLILAVAVAAGTLLHEAFRDGLCLSRGNSSDTLHYFAGIQIAALIISMPAGSLAGHIFSYSPRLLFITIGVLLLSSAFVFSLTLARVVTVRE
ncbi:MFS transporter [Trueperella pyogenes]|uniref:MFS transporter n=1 Tax=Trueperella pyogenes TaxID=1661 RepID=UPI00345D5A02